MTDIRISLDGRRDYAIMIEPGIAARAGAAIASCLGQRRICIICDPKAAVHLPALQAALTNHTVAGVRILAEGESAKTWQALGDTLNWLLDRTIDRHTLVVAFGGGVTGDHAGFAAAIALRGIDFVQIPTTLLAQVDSSVGGKTGINMTQGKNLVGSFHQPRLVLIDPLLLQTLPDRQMRAGYAEIVKYGFIRDAQFFAWLDNNAARILARDEDALAHAIAASCQIKADIVAADERENGERALLNFGHTFGHAIEAACRYDGRVLHGEAVSIGMALAFTVSAQSGFCQPDEAEKAIAHLRRLGLPVRIRDIAGFPDMSPDAVVALMAHDKKAVNGRLAFILSRGIGKAFVTRDIAMDAVHDALAQSMKE